jgi:hypothetical protein
MRRGAFNAARRAFRTAGSVSAEAEVERWSRLQRQGVKVNPCNSPLHPAAVAGVAPAKPGKALSVQEAYDPQGMDFACGTGQHSSRSPRLWSPRNYLSRDADSIPSSSSHRPRAPERPPPALLPHRARAAESRGDPRHVPGERRRRGKQTPGQPVCSHALWLSVRVCLAGAAWHHFTGDIVYTAVLSRQLGGAPLRLFTTSSV